MELTFSLDMFTDDKGYIDRQCPNEKCGFVFKIKKDDWLEKVSDDEVFCPKCGHSDIAQNWITAEQLNQAKEIARNYAMNYAIDYLNKSLTEFSKSFRGNKYFKVNYNPMERISFTNNPIGQREAWKQDIKCERCGTKSSFETATSTLIGSAFFCPCCGRNTSKDAFFDAMDIILNELDSLDEMRELFTEKFDKDQTEKMTDSLLENGLGDCVSAFQKFAQEVYKDVSGKEVRVNDFQIVDKGSSYFKETTGKGYDAYLNQPEYTRLIVLFNRRHVFEHNGGFVDQKYLDNTNDTEYVLGQRLVASVDETKELVDILKKLGKGLTTLL